MRWDDRSIVVMATGGAIVRLAPGIFVKGLKTAELSASGKHGGVGRQEVLRGWSFWKVRR